jgi:CSLREA domain-containing protein
MPAARHVRLPVVVLALVALILGASAAPATAGSADHVFVVTSIDDASDFTPTDGKCETWYPLRCTLRAAIEQANSDAAQDRIEFAIGGPTATGVKTITLTSGIQITQPLIIDGYSQPTATRNTASKGTNAKPKVVLNGPGTGSATIALLLRAPTEVRGLVIQDFRFGLGVSTGGVGSIIAGNFLGTDATGTTAMPNERGMQVDYSAVIGGTKPADRNLISGNLLYGIEVDSLEDPSLVQIQGNLIGTQANGTSALGNGDGVNVNESDGGKVVVGGATAAEGNVIAFNTGEGVFVDDQVSVAVRRNSIFSNGGLGIDLAPVGPTANDDNAPLNAFPPPDTDVGSNDLQNYPIVKSAKTGSTATSVKGTLRTTISTVVRIDFYSMPGDQDEGKKYLGSKSLTTNGFGIANFTFSPKAKVPLGNNITATATDLSDGETSEFSAPKTVTRP